MALPESIVDNGPADRNFRALDERVTAIQARTFGTTWATPVLTAPTATAATANRVYFAGVQVISPTEITGIQWLNVTVSGNVAVALYDDSGARVANVATPVAVTGVISLQQLAFDTAYAAPPGLYFMGIVFSGTPQQYHALSSLPCNYVAGPGSGATATSITPPTKPTALVPTMSTY